VNETGPFGGTGVLPSVLEIVTVHPVGASTEVEDGLQLRLAVVASGDVIGVIVMLPLTRV